MSNFLGFVVSKTGRGIFFIEDDGVQALLDTYFTEMMHSETGDNVQVK